MPSGGKTDANGIMTLGTTFIEGGVALRFLLGYDGQHQVLRTDVSSNLFKV